MHYLQKMISAGAFRPEPPQNLAAMVADIRRWGEVGMIPALNARRTPTSWRSSTTRGSLTYLELDDATNALANGLLAMGSGAATVWRSWRATTAGSPSPTMPGPGGARTILLNTEFSGPQIKDVSEREGAKVIIYDEEYAEAVKLADPPLGKLRALGVNPDAAGPPIGEHETLAEVIARSSTAPAPKATKKSAIIVLTSGTTGTPKGATRHTPPTLAPSAVCCRSCRSRPARSPRCHHRCSTRSVTCTPRSR